MNKERMKIINQENMLLLNKIFSVNKHKKSMPKLHTIKSVKSITAANRSKNLDEKIIEENLRLVKSIITMYFYVKIMFSKRKPSLKLNEIDKDFERTENYKKHIQRCNKSWKKMYSFIDSNNIKENFY